MESLGRLLVQVLGFGFGCYFRGLGTEELGFTKVVVSLSMEFKALGFGGFQDIDGNIELGFRGVPGY